MKYLILVTLLGCCLASPKRQAKFFHDDVSHHEGGHDSGVHGDSVVVENAQHSAVHHGGVHHDAVQHIPVDNVHHVDGGHVGAGVSPVVIQEQRNVEEVPHFPEFGVKVQNEKVKKVERSRGRAVDGPNHNFNYVQVPHHYPAVKALVPPYQPKPVYQNRDQAPFKQPVYQQQQPAYQPQQPIYQQQQPVYQEPPYKPQKPVYQQPSFQQPAYQQSNKFFYPERSDDVAQPAGPVPVSDNAQQTAKPIAILAQNQDVNYDGTFVYDFESENGIRSAVSGNTKRLEGVENPVQVMSGIYSYTSPEGQPVETRWYADETGFHAEGSHLPVAPPVPEAIQRAVDYLKTLPPREDEVAAQPVPASPDVEVSPQRFEQQSFSNQQQTYEKYQQSYDKVPNFRQKHYQPNYNYQQNY